MAHRALRAVRGRDAAAPPVQRKTSYNKNNPAYNPITTKTYGGTLRYMVYPPFLRRLIRLSAHIGGERLIDELLQRLRLLLFRDGAYDGVTHDIAVAVNHIGSGIGKDVGGKLSRLTI